MIVQSQALNEKPRELRRRVMLTARLHAACAWSHARILNVSSHGMMINASASALKSQEVEVWHGEHVIVARVVWRKGTRAGLRADQRLDDLMILSGATGLQRTVAPRWPNIERRQQPRNFDQTRHRSRTLQVLGVMIIAASLTVGAAVLVADALSRPIGYASAALDRGAGVASTEDG